MTLFEMGILCHYAVSPEDHRVVSQNPPIWAATREMFLVHEELLELAPEEERTYKLTPRGQCYVTALQRLPLPVPEWRVLCLDT
jgi:hypothetical protein